MNLVFDLRYEHQHTHLAAKAEMQPGLHILVGRSGSCKTTLLNVLAGLWSAPNIKLRMGDSDWTRVPPAERGIGYAFQNGRLFPHLSVQENLRVGRAKQRDGAQLIETLELSRLLTAKPQNISGGQQRRVGVARALLATETLGLFDEPLAGLDDQSARAITESLHRGAQDRGLVFLVASHRVALFEELDDLTWWHMEATTDKTQDVFTLRPGVPTVAARGRPAI